LLGTFLLLAALATPLAALAIGGLVGGSGLLLGVSADASALQRAAPFMAWLVPLGLLAALCSAWLISANRYSLTILEVIPAVTLIVVLLFSARFDGLLWGITVGTALQVVAMGLLLRASGGLPRPRLGWKAEPWSGLLRGTAGLLAGQILFTAVPLVDPLLAANMGEAAVATISYANRLVLGLQGLLGVAVQRACLPLLARCTVDDPKHARRMALRWSLGAFAVGLVVAAAVFLSADVLVSWVLERGRFTAEDRQQVAALLRVGVFQLPTFMAGLVLVAALAAGGQRTALAWVAVAGVLAKLSLSLAFAPTLGLSGLMMASVVMYAVTLVVAWMGLNWAPSR
jgi:peptidoglycan biosynthesis protein MviN/MurJ (putative lipid II flippase)